VNTWVLASSINSFTITHASPPLSRPLPLPFSVFTISPFAWVVLRGRARCRELWPRHGAGSITYDHIIMTPGPFRAHFGPAMFL